MKKYLVLARLVNPSCYNSGYDLDVYAINKTAAIQSARRMVGNAGHTRQDGSLKYHAAVVD